MAYRPVLRVRVEWEGAVFWFASPDSALSRFGAAMASVAGLNLPAEVAVTAMPPEVTEALADMFVEGVVDWEGVEAEDGKPLHCSAANRRSIPFADKVLVAAHYVETIEAVARGKAASPPAPTDSTPPDVQTANPSLSTTPPASDTVAVTPDEPPLL